MRCEDFIVQPVKQYYAAKTKRSNTHMNYVTKQKLAATYIQNYLITEGNTATRRLRSDKEMKKHIQSANTARSRQ